MKRALFGCMFIISVTGCSGRAVPGEVAAVRAPDQADALHMYTALLGEYVREGRVDYPALCRDNRFASFIAYLAAADPDTITDERRQLAFWLNAYNAYTLKIVCDNYPVKSITNLHFGGRVIGTALKKTIWDKEFAVINGKTMSLNHIEHDIVRRVFDDPRAHFALVCASKSCPALRTEAYEGSKLDEQLDEEGREFFNDPTKNAFDTEKKVARLSKILDWYATDFGGSDKEKLLFVSRFLPEKLAAAIRSDPDAWRIRYMNYDWGLNE